jgi:hypothetical protein
MTLALSVSWLVAAAGNASASCGLPEQRPASPHVFTGVVVSTSLAGRVAVARTDAGEEVVVRGTTATDDNEMTSADRSYVVGGRYEFHPLNATSAFADNACTQTLLLGMVKLDSQPVSPRAWWIGAGVLLAVLVTGLGVRVVRRSRVPRM